MDTQNIENQSAFITYKDLSRELGIQKQELLDNQTSVKKEMGIRMDKVEGKVESIDDKVDDLKDLVLPLTVAMNQTAENTKEMAKSFKEFAESQATTNGMFRDKIHNQDISITDLKHVTSGLTEKKKYNAGVIAVVVTTAGGIVIAIINLAPVLGPLVFK